MLRNFWSKTMGLYRRMSRTNMATLVSLYLHRQGTSAWQSFSSRCVDSEYLLTFSAELACCPYYIAHINWLILPVLGSFLGILDCFGSDFKMCLLKEGFVHLLGGACPPTDVSFLLQSNIWDHGQGVRRRLGVLGSALRFLDWSQCTKMLKSDFLYLCRFCTH